MTPQVTFTKDQLSKIPNKDQWYGLKSVKCDSEAQVILSLLSYHTGYFSYHTGYPCYFSYHTGYFCYFSYHNGNCIKNLSIKLR